MALPQPIKRHSLQAWFSGVMLSTKNSKRDLDRPSRSPRLAKPGILNDFGPALMHLHFEANSMNSFQLE